MDERKRQKIITAVNDILYEYAKLGQYINKFDLINICVIELLVTDSTSEWRKLIELTIEELIKQNKLQYLKSNNELLTLPEYQDYTIN